VVIVESDPHTANQLHAYISKQPKFAVVGIVGCAASAVRMVRNMQPDLLILDLDLDAGGSPDEGVQLLRQLRAQGSAIDVVALSAVSSTRVVRSAVHLGVVDFMVKPFHLERLRQALAAARRSMMAAAQDRHLGQEEIDALRIGGQTRWLPRDLESRRLDQVRATLVGEGADLTATDVAVKASVARTTARRYLEYLVTIGEAEVDCAGTGRGRPSKRYRIARPARIGAEDAQAPLSTAR
jgi:response regulator of citrate/malate metabolism